MKGVTEGKIIHYVLDAGPRRGECRAAIVVRRPNDSASACNLIIFLDGKADNYPTEGLQIGFPEYKKQVPYLDPNDERWKDPVKYGIYADHKFGTWHFAEKVGE